MNFIGLLKNNALGYENCQLHAIGHKDKVQWTLSISDTVGTQLSVLAEMSP